MRILHTADWHLGKTLENRSRLEEQALFIEDLCVLADDKHVDLVIIAGDVYDSINPPAAAVKLFYSGMKKLSQGGARPIIVIAGNHDNPERLTAASPLATDSGIILLGTPKSVAEIGDYGLYTVSDAGEGYVELTIRGEFLVAVTLPYPSEKRLNEIFFTQSDSEVFPTGKPASPPDIFPVRSEVFPAGKPAASDWSAPDIFPVRSEEQDLQKSYSEKVGELLNTLSAKYRKDSINICTGHFYVKGGQTSQTERDIQMGGIFAVDPAALPESAQYIALGHLHRPQQAAPRAFYSGSPLQYSAAETGYAKCVYIAELSPGEEAKVEKIYLRNYKPIEIWKINSIEEALSYCEAHKDDNCWVFLHIKTDRPLLQSEIRQLKLTKKDLIEIRPLLPDQAETETIEFHERSVLSEFMDYYQEVRGAAPNEDIIKLFMSLQELDPA